MRRCVRANRDELRKTIVTYTVKLFRNPFDEAWVADAEARAAFERRIGYDMRSCWRRLPIEPLSHKPDGLAGWGS